MQEMQMGDEAIGKLLWKMCIHTTLSVLLYSIYSLMDTWFVSRGVNELAAGGVTLAAPVLMVLGALSTTVGAGGASIVSRALGKNNYEQAGKATAHALMIFWVSALLIMIAGLMFLEPMLVFMGCDEVLLSYARPYARWLLIGSITSTGFSNIVRAEGNVRYSLYMWIIPVLVNLILDPLFIIVLQMGTAGAGLATFLAQLVTAVMCVYYFFIRKQRIYRLRRQHFKVQGKLIKEIIAVGIPSFIQQMSSTVMAVLLNKLVAAYGGAVAVSAYGIANRIYMFLLLPQNGIVQGMQPIAGFNYGQGKMERVWQSLKWSAIALAVYGIIVLMTGFLTGDWLLGLFIKDEEMAVQGLFIFRCLIAVALIKGILPLAASFFQSIGRVIPALILSVGHIVAVQIPVIYGMAALGRLKGIYYGFIVADVISFIGVVTVLAVYRRRLDKENYLGKATGGLSNGE